MKEWHTKDKSQWRAGPWQDEPDKVQWIDEATNLDCLIVRNWNGALCGYVGVPEGHPWFGLDYCDERVDVECHGGLTFSDRCHEPTEEQFASIGANLTARLGEAARYPDGDAARDVRELREQQAMTFEEWRDDQMGRRICHVPEPGRPEVWWFGFDCDHFSDLAPENLRREEENGWLGPAATYRTRRYVESEVRHLAAQILAAGASAQ